MQFKADIHIFKAESMGVLRSEMSTAREERHPTIQKGTPNGKGSHDGGSKTAFKHLRDREHKQTFGNSLHLSGTLNLSLRLFAGTRPQSNTQHLDSGGGTSVGA